MPQLVSTGQLTIVDTNDGLNARLSNDSHVITTNSDGSGGDYSGCSTTMSVFMGVTEDTSNWSFTAQPSNTISGSLVGSTYTVTDLIGNAGYVDIIASRTGYTPITCRFTVAKSRQGELGPTVTLIPSSSGFTFTDGVATPAQQTISFTIVKRDTNLPVEFFASNGVTLVTNTDKLNISNYAMGIPSTGAGDECYLDISSFGTNDQVTVTAVCGDIVTSYTVLKINNSTAEAGATRNISRGEWNNAIIYAVGDMVLYGGYGWICLQSHTSSGIITPPSYPTTSNTYWQLTTYRGTTGVRGTITTSRAIAGSAWSDSEAVSAISDAGGSSPLNGDVVTLYNNSAGFSQTRVYSSGSTWTTLTAFFGGDVIVNNTVATSKLIVTDTTNLVDDYGFEYGGGSWDSATKAAIATISSPRLGGTKGLVVTGNGTIKDFTHAYVGCRPGDQFYAECWVRKDTASTVGTIGLYATTFLDAGSPQYLTFSTATVSSLSQGVWTKLSGSITIPAGANRLYIRPSVRNDVPSGTFVFDDVVLRRRNEGELIVDGSIIGSKIAANTIESNKIAANTILGSNIAANTITGGNIAANTITASNIAADTITAGQIAVGAIGASEIASGAVTTSKLLVAPPGAALNLDPSFADSSAWTTFGGYAMATFTTVTDGKVGNTVARSSAGVATWMNEVKKIPVDPNKIYRVRCWARNVSGTGSFFYMGVALYDNAGANIAGDGSQWFYAAAFVTPGSSWTEYTGTFGGSIKAIPSTARSMSPLVLLSNGGGTSVQEVQDIRIEEVLPSTLISDGAIITSKIATDAITATKIAAGSVTATKIASESITSSKLAVGDLSVLTINPSFEEGDVSWIKETGWTVVSEPSNAYLGSWVAKNSNAGGGAALRNILRVPCTPGETFYGEAYIKHAASTNGTGSYVRIGFYNAAGSQVGLYPGNTISATTQTYSLSSIGVTAPAGSVSVDIQVVAFNTAGATYTDYVRLFRSSNTVLIADGAISAAKISANAVTADKINAGAVTAAKINVTSLSSIAANVGTLTAGTIRNSGNTYNIDVTSGRTVVQVGSYMKVSGAPFGSSNQFIEWYGPYFSNLASCTEANAVYYLKTDGQAYFGGSLSAGILKNSAQTTSIVSDAAVTVGAFSTNGGTKTIVLSYGYSYEYSCSAGTGSITGSTGAASILLDKSTNSGSTWTTIGTLNATEVERQVLVDGEPGVPDIVKFRIGGSTTFTDNTGATSNLLLRARLTSRTLATFGGTSITDAVTLQNIAVVSTE